ncbi:MAG: N-acetyltransferase [Chloroflexota bacterium]|nr:N-acetyltransferase [Chloroflexota bacterium]
MFISLVAKTKNQIVGHIIFTLAYTQQKHKKDIIGMGLAPLAVLSQFQGQRIGSALCFAGLTKIESEGYPFVVVNGHPGYYPRFGFESAQKFGIETTYKDIPDDDFMIRVFKPEALKNVARVVHYRPEF